MSELSEPDAYPLLFLQGRFAFRKAWARRNRGVTMYDNRFEIAYDYENNFAHMGARYVDEDWGKPKVAKRKPSALSPEALRLLTLMRAAKVK